MSNFFKKPVLVFVFTFFCLSAYAETKVVVIPLFGDDAASKWRGTWANGIDYIIADIVEDLGSSYIATSDHTAVFGINDPSLGTDWDLVAAMGATGITGAGGPAGSSGAQGDPGPQGLPGADGADSIVPGPPGSDGPQWSGAWTEGFTYGTGDIVEDLGSSYIVIAAHTASAGNKPPGVEWEIMAAAGSAQGIPGPQGPEGPTGAQGETGAAGATGAAGMDGSDGDTGQQGPTGLTGATGPQGPIGSAGAQGETGATGAAGTNGSDGAIGPQGPAGAAGTAGTNGSDGAAGPQGPAGLAGATGLQGPTGPAGANGTDGADAPSPANIIWVATAGGDFTDLISAMNSTGSPTLSNSYLIRIAPGEYSLSGRLNMKPYVAIEGSGQNVTTLTLDASHSSTGPLAAMVVGAADSSLSNLSMFNSGSGNVKIGIYNDAVSPQISNVTVSVSGGIDQYGIYNDSAATTISDMNITVGGGGGIQHGFAATSTPFSIIRSSRISAPGNSVNVSPGSNAYISNSILTGSVSGGAKCAFVFTSNGAELDPNCAP